MGLPQNPFAWCIKPSSTINFATTTQSLSVASSATVTWSGPVYFDDLRIGGSATVDYLKVPLSGTIELGTTTQTLAVGSSATVSFAGPWPLARAVHVVKDGVNQTITSSVITKVTFASATFDTLSVFDNVNDRITPNVAGKWLFYGAVAYNALIDGSQFQARLLLNGVTVVGLDNKFAGAAGTQAALVTSVRDMNGSTDYMELHGFQSDGTDDAIVGVNGQTYFGAFYLGA